MTLPTALPKLPNAPKEYNPNVFSNWVLQLENYFRRLNNGGPIVATTAKFTDLPTSSVGLISGEIWHDLGDNTIKRVP